MTDKPTKKHAVLEQNTEMLVRILGQDVPGSKNLYTGLTYIKGVSWSIANALCITLGLNKSVKIDSLSKDEIKQIETGFKQLNAPPFLKNRQHDIETGITNHVYSVELDMRKDFDIKRMKQIKSYKGVRHTSKLPVRGQRTRSHFRKTGVAVGVKKAKVGKKG